MVALVLALWQRTCSRAAITTDRMQSWWVTILERYNEPQRHYHTMTHLEELTRLHAEAEEMKLFHDADAVAWTIFFHDIIYDPKRPDNEDVSADVWLQFCKEAHHDGFQDAQLITRVRQYILQTKNHMACPLDAE